MSLFTEKLELNIEEAELGVQQGLSRLPTAVRWLVILVVVATIPSYFIAKAVSHGIWSAKYKQGAVTAHPSFTNPLPIPTPDVHVTTLGPGQYAAIVQISNPNLDLSLENVPYTFNFYNSQKQQVYNYPGNLFLLPNQTKYITVPTFSSTDPVVYNNFTLPDSLPWQKRLQIPKVSLVTSAPNYYTQSAPPAFVVEGDFYNNSPYTINKVHLVYVLFDLSGQIVGVSQRDESTVAPYERRTYKQLWPNLNVPLLSKVEVTADTDTLDPKNLFVSSSPSGSASDLSRPSAGRQ